MINLGSVKVKTLAFELWIQLACSPVNVFLNLNSLKK